MTTPTDSDKDTERLYAEGVSVGMHRAKTAITIAMNTGTIDLIGLRKVIDKEIAWWSENILDAPTTTPEDTNNE